MTNLRHYLRALVAVVALTGLVACGSPEERVADYVAAGQRFLDEGDLDRASISFRNALRIDAQHPRALFHMGQIHERRDDLRRAYTAYQAAADADPAMVEAHSAYAVLALTAGDLDQVRAAVEKIQAVAPRNADGLALAAAIALREERLDEAEMLARSALEGEPGHVNATSALAGVARARGDAAGAVAVLDRYFTEAGPNVSLALLKIQLLAAEGDTGAVEEAFRQLVSFDPENADFRMAFAEFYRNLGDPVAAEEVLRAAIEELDAEPTSTVGLVRLVYENDGTDAALEEIEQLTGRDEDVDFALGFLAADLLSADGRHAEAEARLASLREAAGPETARGLDASAGIATIDYALDRKDEARLRLDEILTVDGQHRGANYLWAILHLEAGEVTKAVTAGRTALAHDPEWVPGLKVLARAHLAGGGTDLAIDALRRAVEAAPDDVEAASTLAQLLAQRGDYDAALRVWDLVIGQAPNATGALANTAEIAIRQENWNRASRDIDRLLATPGAEFGGTLLAGSLRLAQGDIEGAKDWYERAGSMDPDGAAPLLGLVRSYLADDDVDGALVRVGARTEARPDDALALNLQAQLLVRTERTDEAIASYRSAIEAQPAWSTPYRELAVLKEGAGLVDDAIAVLDEGIDAGADRAGELRLAKAFALQRAERYDVAITVYAALLQAGDDSDLVANNYAALVADFGYDDAAQLERALELAQRFRTSSEAYFLDTLGWLHHRSGDHAQALTYLRRAAAILPDDPHIRYHLGAALHALGQSDSALLELERALPAGADYIGVDDARGLLLELREAEAAMESDPDSAS